jgi:hypothetical protein
MVKELHRPFDIVPEYELMVHSDPHAFNLGNDAHACILTGG